MDEKKGQDQHNVDFDKNTVEDGGSSIVTTVSETSTTSSLSPGRKLQLRHFSLNSSPFASRRPFGLLTSVQQKIQCTGDDDESTFSIFGNEVLVLPSDQKSSGINSSNKVRISQVCKFDWEQRYYYGNLVSCNKTYVAYVVGAKSSVDEHVRVIDHHTSARALLKGFKGKVADLAFKGPEDNKLACVDSCGNLLIFSISEEDGKLNHALLLHLKRNEESIPSEHHHVSWEPGVIKNEESDSEILIAVTHETEAEVYSLKTIFEKQEKEIFINDLSEGVIRIEHGHVKEITNLTIAPDLCVLATWSLDGFVKFWGLNFDEPENPNLLHEWQPHDGEPVTSLFFCDNHLSPDENVSFWRFVLTGSNYNTELKVWCAVSWKCLQVIRFDRSTSLNVMSPLNPFPCIKPSLDISACYLLLSDIKRQVLYVLQFYQNCDEGHAHITSLTEFILAQPLLSYSICETKAHKLNENDAEENHAVNGFAFNGLDDDDDDDDDNLDDGPCKQYKISLKLFGIHTKALQKLYIKFVPTPSMNPPTPSICTGASSADDQMSIRDTMSDLTEGHGSIPSDQDENESSVHLASMISDKSMEKSIQECDRQDSVKSSSSFTTVTALHSPRSLTVQDIQIQSSDEKTETKPPLDQRYPKESDNKNDISPLSSETGSTKFTAAPFRILKRDEPLPEDMSKSISETEDKDEKELFGSLLLDADLYTGVASSAISSHEVQEDLISSSISDFSESETSFKMPLPIDHKESYKNGLLDLSNISSPFITDTQNVTNGENVRHGGVPNDEIRDLNTDIKDISLNDLQKMDHIENYNSNQTDGLLDLSKILPPFTSEKPNGPSTENIQHVSILPNDEVVDINMARQFRSLSLSQTSQKSIDIFPNGNASDMEIKQERKMDLLINLLQEQQDELQQLKQNIAQLTTHVSHQNETLQVLKAQQIDEKEQIKVDVQLLHKSSSSQMSKAVKEFGKTINQRLEQFANDIQLMTQQREEKSVQSLTQILSGRLDKLIKSEIKISVLPALHKLVSPAMDQVTSLVAQKLSAIERILREETEELIKSKPVAETIGLTAATILEGSLPGAYREAFQNVLLPAYERACQQMFVQINKAFTEGTKMHMERLEMQNDGKKQKQIEARDPVLQQLQGLVQNFQATADQLTGSLESNLEALMEKQLSDAMTRTKSELSSTLEKKLTTIIFPSFKAELLEMLEKHNTELNEAIKSIPTSSLRAIEQDDPLPLKDRILDLIEQNDYNQAFEQALTAADLSMVMLLCENVDPECLFSGQDCQLSQPIILSLIQQLSVDLTADTDIKVRYLQQAIMALDTTNEVTEEHMPVVLGCLVKQLDEAVDTLKQSDPHNKQITPLRMLLMITRGYVRKS